MKTQKTYYITISKEKLKRAGVTFREWKKLLREAERNLGIKRIRGTDYNKRGDHAREILQDNLNDFGLEINFESKMQAKINKDGSPLKYDAFVAYSTCNGKGQKAFFGIPINWIEKNQENSFIIFLVGYKDYGSNEKVDHIDYFIIPTDTFKVITDLLNPSYNKSSKNWEYKINISFRNREVRLYSLKQKFIDLQLFRNNFDAIINPEKTSKPFKVLSNDV